MDSKWWYIHLAFRWDSFTVFAYERVTQTRIEKIQYRVFGMVDRIMSKVDNSGCKPGHRCAITDYPSVRPLEGKEEYTLYYKHLREKIQVSQNTLWSIAVDQAPTITSKWRKEKRGYLLEPQDHTRADKITVSWYRWRWFQHSNLSARRHGLQQEIWIEQRPGQSSSHSAESYNWNRWRWWRIDIRPILLLHTHSFSRYGHSARIRLRLFHRCQFFHRYIS